MNDIHDIEEKAKIAKIADQPVASFMTKKVFPAYEGMSIRTAIQMFHVHQISGAPVLDKDEVLKGVVSEHDLLIQAATKDLDSPFTYTTDVIYVKMEARLKDLIVLFYKKRIKRIPVVGAGHRVVGIVSRIDLLVQLATSKI